MDLTYTVGEGVYGRLCLWWWGPSCWRSAGQAVEKKSWMDNGGKGLTGTHKNKLEPIRTNWSLPTCAFIFSTSNSDSIEISWCSSQGTEDMTGRGLKETDGEEPMRVGGSVAPDCPHI